MKPTIIALPGSLSTKAIRLLNENGFCVVEAKNPEAIRFLEVPPVSNAAEQERAAVKLARMVIRPGFWKNDETKNMLAAKYVEILCEHGALTDKAVPPVPLVPPTPAKAPQPS